MPKHRAIHHRFLAFLPLILAGIASLPTLALADPGRVHLVDGSTIQGEILSFEPGVGVSIQMANGSTIELSADDVARVEVGIAPVPEVAEAAPSPAETAVAAPAPPDQVAAPVTRPAPVTRRPGLAAPLVMGSIGLGLVITGAPIYLTSFGCASCYQFTPQSYAGLAVMGIGGALTIAGFAIFLPRRVKQRRLWERTGGLALDFAPTISRHQAGLRLSGTF